MRRVIVSREFAFLLIFFFALGSWYLINSAINNVNMTAEQYNAAVEKSVTGVDPSSVSPTSTASL